jgi:predicted RNA-binding Zn-ribbon protein involved in translation (DUF1610 family)
VSPARLLIGVSVVVGVAVALAPFLSRFTALTRRTAFDITTRCWRPSCGREVSLTDIRCPKCGEAGHVGMVSLMENGVPGQFFRCFHCRTVVSFPQCPHCGADVRSVFINARDKGATWKQWLPMKWRRRLTRR